MKSLRAFTLALGLFAFGCGSDESPPPVEDPAAHACEHVSMAGTALTATADRNTAPAIVIAEEPYTVSLPSGVPGFVRVDVTGAALLFVGTAAVATGLFDEQGTTSLLPQPAPNEDCPTEIPEHFDLDLAGPGPYYLSLGPAATGSLWLMLTEAGGHGH